MDQKEIETCPDVEYEGDEGARNILIKRIRRMREYVETFPAKKYEGDEGMEKYPNAEYDEDEGNVNKFSV